MNFLKNIKLENPALLHLLWALAVFALLLLIYWNWRSRTLRQLGGTSLAERLMTGFSERQFWLKNILFALALTLVALSLANPIREVKRALPERRSADVLLALDISQSMLANDVRPSRLEQAKNFVRELMPALEGERVGLIFFAGDAFTQMPLSTDYQAFMQFVRNANPGAVSEPGTDIGPVFEAAEHLFAEGSEAGKCLIVVSDGEQLEDLPLPLAREVNGRGVVIHTVGVGTAAGGRIPLPGGNFKRDHTGQVVVSRANFSMLQKLAEVGGGQAFQADDAAAVRSLDAAVDGLQKKAYEARSITENESLFQWLIVPALLLLLLDQILFWRKKGGAQE